MNWTYRKDGTIELIVAYEAAYGEQDPFTSGSLLRELQQLQPIYSRQVAALALLTVHELCKLRRVKS